MQNAIIVLMLGFGPAEITVEVSEDKKTGITVHIANLRIGIESWKVDFLYRKSTMSEELKKTIIAKIALTQNAYFKSTSVNSFASPESPFLINTANGLSVTEETAPGIIKHTSRIFVAALSSPVSRVLMIREIITVFALNEMVPINPSNPNGMASLHSARVLSNERTSIPP
jgi:hypothetical protein